MEVCVSFKQGDKVQVKPEVKDPVHGWGEVKAGEVGTIASVSEEVIRIDFPSQFNWAAQPDELLLLEAAPEYAEFTPIPVPHAEFQPLPTFPPSVVPEVTKEQRKSPEKVLAYGVLKKDGKLHKAVTDRDKARSIKAKLGGKQKGVTIVTLNVGKEVR